AASSLQLVADSSSWSVNSSASWLHVAPQSASGTGSALLQFSYDANPDPAVRIGILNIFETAPGGRPGIPVVARAITVMQAGSNYAEVLNVTTPVSSGLISPQGIAVDAAGNIYIADGSANAILEWNAATQQLAPVISGLNDPLGVALDVTGNLYI